MKINLDLDWIRNIRRTLHQYPEIGLEETRTARMVAEHLDALGYEVHEGLARTGVIGRLQNGTSSRSIGIRADMDGLPMEEKGNLSYASRHPGKMHACGHDGHMAMLLGAARALAERRQFDGTIHLIFQPAEENVGGARIMVKEGLFDRFPCDAVFALHNAPQLPAGQFALKEGPIMAAVDEAWITVHGRGGHGAYPENTADPIVAGASIVMALQTIVSRNIQAFDPAVVTVGSFQGGAVSNIIPEEAKLVVGIRSFDETTRQVIEDRITRICEHQAQSYGMSVTVDYRKSYDATVNDGPQTDFIRQQAIAFAGRDNVIELNKPAMGSEDFTYMLQVCPGAIFFIGTGASPQSPSGSKPLHHPEYDFNDDILPIGAEFWTRLAESFLCPDT
ncbi:MAG: amidohydrolase [Desulfobacteraceae bacterium]|nr:MAG: amidohydrolase [Desulfobacteraceae bacterium]